MALAIGTPNVPVVPGHDRNLPRDTTAPAGRRSSRALAQAANIRPDRSKTSRTLRSSARRFTEALRTYNGEIGSAHWMIPQLTDSRSGVGRECFATSSATVGGCPSYDRRSAPGAPVRVCCPSICGRRGRTSSGLRTPSKKLIPAPLMRAFFDVQVHRRDQPLDFRQAVTCAPCDVSHGPQRGRPVDGLFRWG